MSIGIYNNIISVVAVLFFLVTLILLYNFPIYPDEVATRFWLSRFLFDYPYKISNLPTCTSAFSSIFPLTWYVPGIVNWLIHANIKNLYVMRVVGFFAAGVWVCALFFHIRRAIINSYYTENRVDYRLNLGLIALFVSLLAIGVYPVFLFTNRHEQLMLPSVVFLICLFSFLNKHGFSKNLLTIYLLIFVYFTCVSLILYAHPKGMFLAPFFLIIGLKLIVGIRKIFISMILTVLITLLMEQSYFSWKNFFSCPEIPKLNQLIISFSFDPFSFFYDFKFFLNKCLYSLLQFNRYLFQIGFQEITDANYLPQHPLGPMAKFVNALVYSNIFFLFFGLTIYLPYFYFKNDIVRGQYLTVNAVLIVLAGCVFFSALFNLPKNWYDAGYMYSLLIIILVFFVSANLPSVFPKKVFSVCFFYIVIVGLLSQLIFAHRYARDLQAGYAGPSVGLVGYVYDKNYDSEFSNISSLCKIDLNNSKHLIVDDYTYFYFSSTRMPMPITYIYLENEPENVQDFIRKSESSGMVVRCDYMPLSLAPLSQRSGGLCCISQENLRNVNVIR
ncbi:hypothetical protein [Methylomonas albis]|uniref:Glycosyltransferase RgtA/B/C/D-like domain-containing protein n=1 Tax=Methylomonas albis TaxID=1854563 RepID=A0ABR9D0Q6_9GAMM|nr:hypothetical protein [Methylomonas albis]MBD9356714.1 hypothetical protein [Methylomonas albis]CAD6879859.1 hypothetical protein [Methylomonas albis]